MKAKRVQLSATDLYLLTAVGDWFKLTDDRIQVGAHTRLATNIDSLEFQIEGQRFNLRLIKYELVP